RGTDAVTRVLVVDDEPALLRAVGAALRARSYDVATAGTGQAAIDAIALAPPDVVVLDLGLPDLDGIDVCRRVREWSDVPIVVLSAEGSEERKVLALDQGADDYVTKPFSTAELLARIRVALRHRKPAAQEARRRPRPSQAHHGAGRGVSVGRSGFGIGGLTASGVSASPLSDPAAAAGTASGGTPSGGLCPSFSPAGTWYGTDVTTV